LDAGLTVSEIREVLVQLYAYTGFPRSLNALGQLMKVLDARKQRGIQDPAGREPSALPREQRHAGAGAPRTRRSSGQTGQGSAVRVRPAIDDFLKRHLFGDIFARDNLDWQSRELATVGALAAMPGVESQLQAHIASA
jgi:alkylhydroperoxidase/carboxymuconolactone decarboxylase family protein YurZ